MSDVLEQFEKLNLGLKNLSEASVQNVLREMTAIEGSLVEYVRRDKLSGQVLNRRSGRLQDSVYAETELVSDVVRTTVGTKGAPYASAHEYGETVRIPEYSGKLMVFRGREGTLVFTRNRRAYEVHLPERSFIRSTIADKEIEISERLRESVARGLPA